MDEGTVALLNAVRVLLKGHIKRERDLIAYLTELEKRLDTHSQEAERHGTEARDSIAV